MKTKKIRAWALKIEDMILIGSISTNKEICFRHKHLYPDIEEDFKLVEVEIREIPSKKKGQL